MRKVVYFYGGTVADFAIPDDRFEDFTRHVKWDKRHSQDDLAKARQVLEAFVRRSRGSKSPVVGSGETVAACFVWSYFNTHPDDKLHIDGDVVIIDVKGDGSNVDYASTADVQLTQEH